MRARLADRRAHEEETMMDTANIESIINDTGKALDIAAHIAAGIELAVGARKGAADTVTNPTKQGLLVGILQMFGQWIGPGTKDQLDTIANGGVAKMNAIKPKPVVTVTPDSQTVAVDGSTPVTVTVQIGAMK